MNDRTIVTFEPRDTTPARPIGGQPADLADDGIAPVVPLRPVTMYGNTVHRLIQPLDVAPGTRLDVHGAPGRLASALMATAAGAR